MVFLDEQLSFNKFRMKPEGSIGVSASFVRCSYHRLGCTMNYIDIIICIPLVWGLYKGFTKGLIVEAATIVAFSLGVWGGIHFSDFLARKLREWFGWQSPYLPLISFALVFLAIIVLIYFIAKLIQKAAEGAALSAVNKIGGAVFGALKFAMVMSIIIFMLDAVEESYPVLSLKTKEDSLLYIPVGKIAPTVIPALNKSKVAAMMPKAEDVEVEVKLKDKKVHH
jgi:membrane protein required for colicin V production